MLVQTIISLKNVGRFMSLSSKGGELRKLTLVYGPNVKFRPGPC